MNIDKNECALGTHNCDSNATCANTQGSFTCSCNSGYYGSGTTCNGNNFFLFFFHLLNPNYFNKQNTKITNKKKLKNKNINERLQ